MPPLVETAPYPWTLPEARELHIVLCQIYPTGRTATFPAQEAGLSPAFFNSDQPGYLVWKEILELAANSGKLKTLVERVRDQNSGHPRAEFFDALVKAETPVLDGEPRGALGAPLFVTGTDDITRPEALLYHDDLTLEIGRVPWLIGVLTTLKELAPSVCRFQVTRNAETKRGTGFRIGTDLLLTNWHVLTILGEPATKVVAEFGYEDDGQGGGLPSTAYPCDAASMITHKPDDWGIVRVTQPLPDTIPILKLSEAAEPVLERPAFIVQHPGGERKRVGYVRNQVTSFNERTLHYLCDTQVGSSGSPVLDDTGRLIGLHHAGGRPQEVAGKPPIRKNEGIRIPAVIQGLANAGVQVP